MKLSTFAYKTRLSLIILFFITFRTFSQIVVTNAPYSNGSVNYTLFGYSAVPHDLGTNYYVWNPFSGIYNYISRQSNTWTGGSSAFGSVAISFKLTNPATSNEIDPPCGGIWEKWETNSSLVSQPSGEFYYVTITGSCSTVNNPPPPSQSVVISPYGMQLPSYTNQDILNIPNPQPGMMVWDITNSCVSVFNGLVFNCL